MPLLSVHAHDIKLLRTCSHRLWSFRLRSLKLVVILYRRRLGWTSVELGAWRSGLEWRASAVPLIFQQHSSLWRGPQVRSLPAASSSFL